MLRFSQPAIIILFVILLYDRCAEGNVRFICPRPTTPRSDQESVTFLPLDLTEHDVSNAYVSDLDPGMFSVHFEETKFQPDSPFRISLLDISAKLHVDLTIKSDGDNATNATNTDATEMDGKSCLLLDHIPHNNHAVVTKECSQKGNEYPVGMCNESSYYITIKIPDVTCNDCLLILQQVIARQDHQVCDLSGRNDTNATDCITYTSYARVRIRPSSKGVARNLNDCLDYLGNLPGDWPYRPQDVYKTDEGAVLTFDPLHKDLHIEFSSGLLLGPLEKVEIRHNVTVVWNTTIRGNSIGNISVTWAKLHKAELELLKEGHLVLNIVGSKKSLAADIEFSEQHFSEGRISALHDSYSESGWLIAPKFLGPQAEDPAAAVPSGHCAPQANYYMAYLQSVHVTAHGILGMSVLENRAYITVVLHVNNEVVQNIRIKGPDLVGLPMLEVDVPPSFDGVAQAAFDITSQLPFINTIRFFKTVEVNTDKENAVLVGDLEEGMFTILRDENGEIHGLGGFQFTQGQWLRIEIVMNDLSPSIETAVLYGPDFAELADISRDTVHCSPAFCCLEALIQEPESKLVLNLMKGQAMLHIVTLQSDVLGKVHGSPLRYCQLSGGACGEDYQQFSIGGLGVEVRNGEMALSAMEGWTEAETFVLDRANVLHYCVQLDNLNVTGRYFTVALLRNGQKMDEAPFKLLKTTKDSYLACSSLPLGDDLPSIASLAHTSHKWVFMTVNDGEEKFLSKDLPSVSRGDCIQTKDHVVGRHKQYWSQGSAPLQDIYAVVSDHLNFYFDKNSSVFLIPSKEDYDACIFSRAKRLFVTDAHGEKALSFHTLTQTGTVYFADLELCNASKPLKLTVHVIAGVSMVQDDTHDAWCRKSVYSMWRDKQLKAWEEPEVSGPILIGLVVGLSSAGAFLLWQGIRLKRIPDSFRGNSDNVFVRF